jgi:hypothetical protein
MRAMITRDVPQHTNTSGPDAKLQGASPGGLSGLVGGKARHARAQKAALEIFQRAPDEHGHAEDTRVRRLQSARAAYDQMADATEAAVREHNAAVGELESNFRAGVPDAVEEYFSEVLALSEYPTGFPQDYQVAYRQEPRELVVEYRLPAVEVVPSARDFRYVKTRSEIDELARPLKEISASLGRASTNCIPSGPSTSTVAAYVPSTKRSTRTWRTLPPRPRISAAAK